MPITLADMPLQLFPVGHAHYWTLCRFWTDAGCLIALIVVSLPVTVLPACPFTVPYPGGANHAIDAIVYGAWHLGGNLPCDVQ